MAKIPLTKQTIAHCCPSLKIAVAVEQATATNVTIESIFQLKDQEQTIVKKCMVVITFRVRICNKI